MKFNIVVRKKFFKKVLNNLFDTTVAIGVDRQFVFENIIKTVNESYDKVYNDEIESFNNLNEIENKVALENDGPFTVILEL